MEKFGEELSLLTKNFIGKEGLYEWIAGIDPTSFKIEKTNEHKFLHIRMRTKAGENPEPEQDLAIEFLVFIMWVVSYTVQQFFLKKGPKTEAISGLNPHIEMDWDTKESISILNIFYRKTYEWLAKAWGTKDLSIFEEFVSIRHINDYYNSIANLIGILRVEIPSITSDVLARIIEEKSKQNWIEKLKKPNNKEEIKKIIINRYFNRIFEDIKKLTEDAYNKKEIKKILNG